jgi:hypothetical protein
MGLYVFGSIQPMRELCPGGVKVPFKWYHLDRLIDVECAYTELNKAFDGRDDNLDKTL